MTHHDDTGWCIMMMHTDDAAWCIIMVNHHDSSWWIIMVHHDASLKVINDSWWINLMHHDDASCRPVDKTGWWAGPFRGAPLDNQYVVHIINWHHKQYILVGVVVGWQWPLRCSMLQHLWVVVVAENIAWHPNHDFVGEMGHQDNSAWWIVVTHHDEAWWLNTTTSYHDDGSSWWVIMTHHDDTGWCIMMMHTDDAAWCIIMVNHHDSSWWIIMVHHDASLKVINDSWWINLMHHDDASCRPVDKTGWRAFGGCLGKSICC